MSASIYGASIYDIDVHVRGDSHVDARHFGEDVGPGFWVIDIDSLHIFLRDAEQARKLAEAATRAYKRLEDG